MADVVVVVGSANLDVVLSVAQIPRPGETVVAGGSARGPGGKGANQAIAAARSGARTAFVGAVGSDAGGQLLRSALEGSGVDVSALRQVDGSSGTAYVVVDGRGENCIVVDAGANASLTSLTPEELTVVRDAQVVLCQLEIPLDAVLSALSAAREAGVRTVLNAAPARALPPELLASVEVLVVNEHEALTVADVSTLEDAVRALLERVPEVVVTLGAAGALVGGRTGGLTAVPGVPARVVVDTTGAGDTFCGALAAAQSRGDDLVQAARTACAAASLSVETAGAGSSAPRLPEILKRLRRG